MKFSKSFDSNLDFNPHTFNDRIFRQYSGSLSDVALFLRNLFLEYFILLEHTCNCLATSSLPSS